MKIFLVGFMGTGKTAVGKLLAEKLNLKFRDLDQEIELEEECSINEIFGKKGEEAFRNIESQVLQKNIQEDDIVIATGGGVLIKDKNRVLLLNKGICICLTASFDDIKCRVLKSSHRPLLKGDNPEEQIKNLLKMRKPLYDGIADKIDTTSKTIGEVTEELMKLIQEKIK